MATYILLTVLVAFYYDPPNEPLPPRGERHDLEHVAAAVIPLVIWSYADVPLWSALAVGLAINAAVIWRRERTRRRVRRAAVGL